MFIRVAVWDPLPIFCRGLLTALSEAGFQDSEVPEDLLLWAREAGKKFLLMTLSGPDDWRLLAELGPPQADLNVLAVLADPDLPSYVRAVRAGAVAVVPRCAAPHLVQQTFAAAVEGKSLLPVDVVRAMTLTVPNGRVGPTPSEQEIAWLGRLAHGSSVVDLAEQAGYSERMMFRLLRALYAKLDVSNRTEAVIRARDEGWL